MSWTKVLCSCRSSFGQCVPHAIVRGLSVREGAARSCLSILQENVLTLSLREACNLLRRGKKSPARNPGSLSDFSQWHPPGAGGAPPDHQGRAIIPPTDYRGADLQARCPLGEAPKRARRTRLLPPLMVTLPEGFSVREGSIISFPLLRTDPKRQHGNLGVYERQT